MIWLAATSYTSLHLSHTEFAFAEIVAHINMDHPKCTVMPMTVMLLRSCRVCRVDRPVFKFIFLISSGSRPGLKIMKKYFDQFKKVWPDVVEGRDLFQHRTINSSGTVYTELYIARDLVCSFVCMSVCLSFDLLFSCMIWPLFVRKVAYTRISCLREHKDTAWL